MERIGHRGAKREMPENTIPAFRRAFERGADAIELDVHATRDGVVVVHHDPALHRPPPGTKERAIASLDWETLQRAELVPGVPVPSLAEVFAIVPAGKAVYVEIKGRGIETALAAVLRTTAVACAVHSFDHDAVARMRELVPEIPRGILFDRAPGDARALMDRTGARDVWPEWKLANESLVGVVHDAGRRIIAWTVNARGTAERLAELGVDGICTDDVRLLDAL